MPYKNQATIIIKNLLPIESYQLSEELKERFEDNIYRITEQGSQLTITLYQPRKIEQHENNV